VDVVLTGGAGPEFSYQALNQAFSQLQRAARLVAMHRGLYWRTSGGLQLDAGAFLVGLEQAAATDAEVVVKTGKYLPRTHQHASGTPNHVLDSFADLPALLERLA
jgi:ribonucleotide monophosphatase NagD (HAD superfamily)